MATLWFKVGANNIKGCFKVIKFIEWKKIELKKIETFIQKQLTKSSFIINKISSNNYICPYV